MLAEPDTLQLTLRIGEQSRFFASLQMREGAQRPRRAAQMRAERDILDDAHVGREMHMLERAADAEPRHVLRPLANERLAAERDRAARQRNDAGQKIECRAFPGAVRADEAQNLAGSDLKTDVVHRNQSAEGLPRGAHLQQGRSRGGSFSLRQRHLRRLRQFRRGAVDRRSAAIVPAAPSRASRTRMAPKTIVS